MLEWFESESRYKPGIVVGAMVVMIPLVCILTMVVVWLRL